ncbi:MAG: helix-turn-helix transcriptional regulator [Bryobacteraceae bacterium]|nr:helix-turn-helix transcriptional regulator [Bryobacteraceae bacterium]
MPVLILTMHESEQLVRDVFLQALIKGDDAHEFAAALEISVKTVETHRAHIMAKLDLHSVPELVRYAIRNHIIES